MSRQAVVKHLGALAAAGLLDTQPHGREVRYGVVPGQLGGASSWLADVGTRWDHRLAALQRQLAVRRTRAEGGTAPADLSGSLCPLLDRKVHQECTSAGQKSLKLPEVSSIIYA